MQDPDLFVSAVRQEWEHLALSLVSNKRMITDQDLERATCNVGLVQTIAMIMQQSYFLQGPTSYLDRQAFWLCSILITTCQYRCSWVLFSSCQKLPIWNTEVLSALQCPNRMNYQHSLLISGLIKINTLMMGFCSSCIFILCLVSLNFALHCSGACAVPLLQLCKWHYVHELPLPFQDQSRVGGMVWICFRDNLSHSMSKPSSWYIAGL